MSIYFIVQIRMLSESEGPNNYTGMKGANRHMGIDGHSIHIQILNCERQRLRLRDCMVKDLGFYPQG